MVLIEDITEQEAERQAAEKAAEAAVADARQATAAGAEQDGDAQAAAGEGPSTAGEDIAASQQPIELTEADKVSAAPAGCCCGSDCALPLTLPCALLSLSRLNWRRRRR